MNISTHLSNVLTECQTNPCQNNGTCTPENHSYMIYNCSTGWTSKNDGFKCNCTGTGYIGLHCSIRKYANSDPRNVHLDYSNELRTNQVPILCFVSTANVFVRGNMEQNIFLASRRGYTFIKLEKISVVMLSKKVE